MTSHGITHREAYGGAGQTDLLFAHHGSTDECLIETKVPDSLIEFADGLVEIAQHAISNGVKSAYYVVVDHCSDLASPRYMGAGIKQKIVDGIEIACVSVRIAKNSPSKVGAARRRSKRQAAST